jgi:molybdopterin/thiamine biosynthesis adenylyltransferase/DNA-binding transcriptional regulator YhcF (GntR family)
MKIQPIAHRTLADRVSGRLAAWLLDGSLRPGDRLPSERDLMTRLEVSRATLREALTALAENGLVEARSGVGWFARELDADNVAQAHELAREHRQPPSVPTRAAGDEPPTGPRPLTITPSKPLHIPNLRADRQGTFDFISWWERERVQAAKVLVVGAGALGNEVIKNLALMGVGHLFIVDFDTVEAANLSRSVLFRPGDTGRSKAEVAAARAKDLNPHVRVQYSHTDVNSGLGLGVVRRMDVVIGCLDNREARLAVNRYCYWMNKPWVDGAIQELLGLERTCVPGEGACFECTLTEQARRELAMRYSCPLLARENVLLGKVPTTPTIASIIGSMQSQEALKLLHGLPLQAGKVTHFNGMLNEMHTSAYRIREECESHWVYGEMTELPARAGKTTLDELLRIARSDLGDQAVLELDHELILSLSCAACQTTEQVLRPLSEVSFEAGHCPACGALRQVEMTHVITGEEPFLHRTLASVGVPALHILRARNASEYRFYELTGDLAEGLHFNDFHGPASVGLPSTPGHIRLGEEVALAERPRRRAEGRILLRD